MKKSSLLVAAIGLTSVIAAQAAVPTNLLGDPSSAAEATRTIQISPKTKYVNVTEGEVVKFVANGQEFAFKFDGPSVSSFNLQRVAPAGALDHPVVAYVAPEEDGGHGGHSGHGGHGR